jgi:antitoxin VapB
VDDGSILPKPLARAALADESCRAKLFMHGGSQAVRLPKAFRFEGAEVSVRKEGDAVILEPVTRKSPQTPEDWAVFWKGIDDLGLEGGIECPPRDRTPWRDPPSFDAAE